MASELPAGFDLAQYIQGLYQNILGREPDNAGRSWWENDPQVQQWLASGGAPKLESAFRSGIRGEADARFDDIKSNMAPYANNLTQPNAFAWDDYMTRAATEQQGMNNMPGVFSAYGALATATPEQANAMLYRTQEDQKAAIADANAYWQATGGFGGLGASGGSMTPTVGQDGSSGPRRIGDYVLGDNGRYARG